MQKLTAAATSVGWAWFELYIKPSPIMFDIGTPGTDLYCTFDYVRVKAHFEQAGASLVSHVWRLTIAIDPFLFLSSCLLFYSNAGPMLMSTAMP